MKKLIILLSVFILFNQGPEHDILNEELPQLVQIGKKEGLELNEWQVVGIDVFSNEEFDNITKSLRNSYFVTMSNEENAVKYTFESKDRGQSVEHSFHAIKSLNDANHITFQTIISGHIWNEKVMNNYIQLTKELQDDYNIMFDRNFTCLKFGLSGIINNGFSFDEFWRKMKVVHKTEQYDNVQHSTYEKEIYGYSPLWDNEIIVNDEKINFHITLKNNDNNKRQVIVGTPMILNEY